MIWLNSSASSDLLQTIKYQFKLQFLRVWCGNLPFDELLVTWVKLVVFKVSSLQKHIDLLLSLLKADLLLQIALLLLIYVSDSNLVLDKVPEDVLEIAVTAMVGIHCLLQCLCVHHLAYLKLFN